MPLSTLDNLIKDAIAEKINSPVLFEDFKKKFCAKFKVSRPPTNADVRAAYDRLVKRQLVKRSPELEKALLAKRIRSLSGVAVVAVLTRTHPCRGNCLYCPTETAMPKSYLSNEPAVMRAIAVGFDPYLQVQKRLRALRLNGHPTDKIELIVMGGTFSDLPLKYQFWFVKECFRAANDFPRSKKPASSMDLALSIIRNELLKNQKRNEKADSRIVGLTLETRPDAVTWDEAAKFRVLGSTRVEMGVQSIDENVLRLNRRGHGVGKVVSATKILKDSGFKISYHLMPGLYGSNTQKDIEMFRTIFSDPRFQPDLLKIYPCVVTENCDLYELWKNGTYSALSNERAFELLKKIKALVPPYVRISRLIRDIPSTSIVAGPKISNLRQILKNSGVSCQCVRCREIRHEFSSDEAMVLKRTDYEASRGTEVFLEFCSPDATKLFSMLRLRIPSRESLENPDVFPELKNAALLREIHTYGKMVPIKKSDPAACQHARLGQKLIAEAEMIARKEFGIKKIAVISGVGVRGYYRKFGYRLRGTYMVKKMV